MKSLDEAMSLYRDNVKNAVKYFISENGKRGTEYNYYNGMVHGIGEVMGYEYRRIEADIEKALAAANGQS